MVGFGGVQLAYIAGGRVCDVMVAVKGDIIFSSDLRHVEPAGGK